LSEHSAGDYYAEHGQERDKENRWRQAFFGRLPVQTAVGSPRSWGDAFLLDRPVDTEAAGLQVSFLGKEEEDDGVVFQSSPYQIP
jgi:hypothetical protein